MNAFDVVWESIKQSAWGQAVDPAYAPALARDVLYDLEQAGFKVDRSAWFTQ